MFLRCAEFSATTYLKSLLWRILQQLNSVPQHKDGYPFKGEGALNLMAT